MFCSVCFFITFLFFGGGGEGGGKEEEGTDHAWLLLVHVILGIGNANGKL